MTSPSSLHATAATRGTTAILLCLMLSACDKVKEISDSVKTKAEEVTSKVGDSLEERLDGPQDEPKVNPLMRLVDHNEEGYVFRKDIEFPTELTVKTVHKQKVAGRIFRESELGRDVESVKGKETVNVGFERKGSTVTYTIKGSSFELPATGNEEEGAEPKKVKNPFRQAPPPSKPMTYLRQGDGWKGRSGGDFKLMAMNQQLSPVFGDLLTEHGVLPRPLWFSTARVKVGDELELSGGSLAMVITGKPKGKVKIRLEGIEDINDHPCGRFTIIGQYSRRNFPNPEGRLMDQEVSVESGEIWLSLLYPVILKEKLKTIQTFSPSEGGGSIGRAQGTVDTLVVREWIADIPIPEEEPAPDAGDSAADSSGEAASND